jgi:hypothetical protein
MRYLFNHGEKMSQAKQFTGQCTFPECMCNSKENCRYTFERPAGFAGASAAKSLRDGDQQLPTPNNKPAIQDLVMQDMLARKLLGQQRYGTPLQAHNGRDMMQDLYEELLDACNYIRGMIYERDGK